MQAQGLPRRDWISYIAARAVVKQKIKYFCQMPTNRVMLLYSSFRMLYSRYTIFKLQATDPRKP